MDQMENYSEELQDQSEETQLSSRPSLSRVRKSWGFRRTTIARREFLEEVGDLAHSPPPVRKTRSRRSNQTTPETQESLRDTPNARSVVDELEWSAPSSPVAENKPDTEMYAGGNLDPSLWQDCGSAFHTAFSLLGGGESFQVEMPDAYAVPDPVEASTSIEPYDLCVTDKSVVPNEENFPDGIHDGETLIRETDEMLTQKGGQELKYPTRGVKGRKERGRSLAIDESAKPNNEDSPDGEMLLREIGEMLTRKSGQEQKATTIRGVRGGKGRGRLCATNEPAMPKNEDSPDDGARSVLGDVGADTDVVLISSQGGRSEGEMLLRATRKMLTRSSGQEQRAAAVKGIRGRRGNTTSCATGDSAMPINEESLDDTAHSVLGGVRLDSDVVLISQQEAADSDSEMTLIEISKLPTPEDGQEQRDTIGRGGKGRGRKKGRGRGRKKAKARGKAGGLQSKAMNEDVVIVNPIEEEQAVQKINVPDSPIQISTSPAQSVSSLSPQQSSSDCIFIESDVDQVIGNIHDQFNDAPEQKGKEVNENEEPPPELDSDALTCTCCQKRNDRFMIRCVGCQEWFHGNCVGIGETGSCTGYVCSTCVTKNQSEQQPNCCPQLEDECSLPQGLTPICQDEVMEGKNEEPEKCVEEEERIEAPVINLEPEPQAKMKKDGVLPLCIGPGCPREALPDSVYCGTDCILQHAAATMKTFSVPKESKARGGIQMKHATTTASAKGQRLSGTSTNLGTTAEGEDQKKDDDGGQEEAAPPSPCDPAPTEVQATSLPSSKLYTASKMEKRQEVEAVALLNKSLEDSAADVAASSQPVSEPETPKEPVDSSLSSDTHPCTHPNTAQYFQATASEKPSTSAPTHHETGALTVNKKAFIIPKKPLAPQPSSSAMLASSSGSKPSPAPSLLNETRNLLVPPAPSAPSSRPSQPNNQIRQSIQKSLVSILIKRVGDCEDLKLSESEVVKLVASIEVEMFNIFRNTDSKYMNKYRTIMFNLKDPRNKGLLYGFVRGEISPFRLVRMTQKDMQAIKATEIPEKQTSEVKDAAASVGPAAPAKVTSVLTKPETVKVNLPSLNPVRPNRNTEHKKSLPPPAVKTKTIQGNQSSTVPDILTCMLKDTTSEHKTHIFDLKCKICTGQVSAADEEEPLRKKPRVSETRDRHYPSWRKSTEEDSPLQAPPESPDLDSPTLFIMDTSSHLTIDSPVLTIVESPASPIMDSPASPVSESPASPAMESPASPTPDPPKAFTSKSAFTEVVNPAVSMTTITRRDPRRAAGRISSLSNSQSAPYVPSKETRLVPQTAPGSLPLPAKMVPKSILKPLSADPRFYSALSRSVTSESPSMDEMSKFLAKQEILWKGFINMLTVAKFVSKAYLVSGSAENLKSDLPDTIQIGGRILPETVWDYMEKVKTSVTKELCVIRFHPATEEEEVAYVSLFSYFSSRRRFGVVASGNRSIKDLYLLPLGANESVPSMLQPFEGPGLETKRPNLLLGLAIIQRTKRSGSFPQEIEEKRPKVHLAKDPMWIPKPPVLYGSDKLDMFQPYDPETPANLVLPSSPSCPGSPSDSSSSLTQPSLFTSVRPNPNIALSVTVPATLSTSNCVPDKPPVAPSEKTPLQTILSSLFGSKPTESTASSDVSSTNPSCVKKPPALSQVAGTMVDPIVQQYGQKSKIKEIAKESDFDRPYDPEEEYDPGVGFAMTTTKSIDKNKVEGPSVPKSVDDDVAYDPEDETIFACVSGIPAKPAVQNQISDSSSCGTPIYAQATTTPTSTTSSDGITPNLPLGTVVVSAATLNEQQRMLEELNKQIEEQKRQLKEQEEALRQQREAVGIFMAQFSVSDSMVAPPTKSLPLSQLASLKAQAEIKPSEMTEKTSKCSEISSNTEKQTVEPQDIKVLKDDTDNVSDQDKTHTDIKEGERYSSAGEIEDSDVAYDPEDESFFKEVEEEPLEGNSGMTYDRALSRRIRSTSQKGNQNCSHSRKRRLSPKKRSHRERDHRRSPSKKSQRRSSSHSHKRRDRDRHRRSDRDRSRHRGRDHSERQGRHRKEHNMHRQSRGRRSPSSLGQVHVSFSPEHQRLETPMVSIKTEPDECNCGEYLDESCSAFSHDPCPMVKAKITEQPTSDELLKKSFRNDDPAQGTSMQVNKPVKQEDQIESKIESMIPLREIDPPLRDSPESPDPEPQFVKASSIETRDTANTEKMQVPGMPPVSSSNLILHLKNKNNEGRVMIESRTTEQLVKCSEGSPALNYESSIKQGMSTEVKSLLGVTMQVKTPEPEKTNDTLGVHFQQHTNVAEPNVLGSGTESSSDCNTLAGSGAIVPREDQIFPPNRRIEQTGQEDRPFIPNITNPDWRGHDFPASGMRSQTCENLGFDPHVIDSHCTVQGSNVQDHWREPNKRGPGVVRGRGGPFVQNERKHQLQWRGPNIDNPRHNRNSPMGQDFITSGPDTEGPVHDRRDLGNPYSRRRDSERGGPNNNIGGPRGATVERRTLLVEGPAPHRRGQTAPAFRESEPWIEQRNVSMKSAEAGPGNLHSLGPDCLAPDYLGLEPENTGYPMDRPVNDKEGLQGPNFRGPQQYVSHPQSDKRRLGCLEFKGPVLDRRSLREAPDSDRRGPDKSIPFMRSDRMGPDFQEGPEAEWTGLPLEGSKHMRTSFVAPMGALEPGRIGAPGPESWRPEVGISDPNINGPGPKRMAPGSQNLSRSEPDYPGAWTRGSGPDFMGMRPENPRRRGSEPFRISDQECQEFQNLEGPDSAHFRGMGLKRRPMFNDRPHNIRDFPDSPQFIMSAPERRSPAMDGCESDKRCSPFRGVKSEGPALEDPTNIRIGFRGLDTNSQPSENIGTDIRGPEPNRQEQGVLGLREHGDEFAPGIRHKDPVVESRPKRDNWHETEFVGLEPIQGVRDMEGPGSKGTRRTFRGPRGTNVRPRSESESWKEPNFRDSSLERRGMDLHEQWGEGRGLNIDWEQHRDIGPRFTHEGPDEQFDCRQVPMEWRISENRGPKMIQERPNMQGRGSRCESNGSDFRSQGLVRDHPTIVHPGSTREESREEIMSQDSDEQPRWGSGISFRGSRDPDNRRKNHGRKAPIMRGPRSDLRLRPEMENDFRQPDFRDNIKGSNMEGHNTFSRGLGFENSSLNREEEIEDLERRVPQSLGSECPQSESRNFTFDGPEANRRFSPSGRMRSERQGDNMESLRSFREGSEGVRRVNRAPNMRRLGPDETNMRDLVPECLGVRHGPGRWNTPTDGSRSESRRGRPALTRFNSPSEVARFQVSSGPLCSVEQSQQGAQPQQRKAALLPTPTGPICFPTHAVKNSGSFVPEGKYMGLSMPRRRGRGRSVNRDR